MMPSVLRASLALTVLLIACQSSRETSGAARPSSGPSANAPTTTADQASAAVREGTAVPYQDVVAGAALPPGHVLQLGAPRWSHPGIADQVQLLSTGAIVSASSSHVRLWEARSGALRWQVFTPSTRTKFAISPDERWIAIAQGDFDRARVSVHELGGQQRISFEAGPVSDLAFSPDGARLAVASSVVSVYEPRTGARLETYKTLAFSVGFSADGRLITVGRDRIQRWRDAGDAGPEPLAAVPASSRVSAVNAPATLVAWADGANMTVMPMGGAPTTVEAAAPATITALALSAAGDAALVSWAGGLAAWDLTPKPKKRWAQTVPYHSRPAVGLAPSGKQAVAADARGVFMIDAQTGKGPPFQQARLGFVGFASDGDLVVARGKEVQRMDLRTRALSADPGMPKGAPPSADRVLYGAGGLAVAWDSGAQSECRPFSVWVTGRGEQTISPPPGCQDAPWTVGPGFVAADGAATTIWDLLANTPRLVLPSTPRPRLSLSFSVDRRWLVAAYGAADAADRNEDHRTSVVVFDLAAAKAAGPLSAARELEWLPDASLRAVTILSNGTVIAGAADGALYTAPRGAEAFERRSELGAAIVLLEPSPSGRAFAAMDEDGLTAIVEP